MFEIILLLMAHVIQLGEPLGGKLLGGAPKKRAGAELALKLPKAVLHSLPICL